MRPQHSPILTVVLLALASALAIGGAAGAAEPAAPSLPPGPIIGLWDDRSGIHPGSNPPVRWDSDTGLNILWHTPTPSFSNSAPTVLKDRVIYLNDVDPEHPFPLLVGLDLATGRECWRVEINPLGLSIPDAAKRKEVEDLWVATLRWRGGYSALHRDWSAATDKAPLAERMKRLGLKADADLASRTLLTDGVLDGAKNLLGAPWTDPWKTLDKAGLVGDTWRYHCYGLPGGVWFPGETFATPISDGRRVYIQISWGVWAAYDRDGKLIWMQHLPSKGQGDHCLCARSPLIWRDRLVADIGDWVRAFDLATGKQIWSCSRRANKIGQHEMESPMVVTVGGKDYAYCNGYPPFAVRLEDGKACLIEGPNRSPGINARTDPDRKDVIYLCGGGQHGGWDAKPDVLSPAAIRLLPGDGDNLRGEVLWHGVNGQKHGDQFTWMVCCDGRLFYRDVILDAASGKVLLGRPGAHNTPDQAVPGSTYTLAIAGGRIYGQGYAEHGSEKRKDDLGAAVNCEVYDLAGRRLAVNRLRGLGGQAAFRAMNNVPNWYSYANNFTVIGDRILSRSMYEVICIGEISRAYSDAELAAVTSLGDKPTLEAALAQLDAPRRAVRVAAAQVIGRLGAAAAAAAGKLAERVKGGDANSAEAAMLALCAMGRHAEGAAAELAALARGEDSPRRDRARRALAAMGPVAEKALLAAIDDEAGYVAAMQTAALMEDYDAATRILAGGLLGGKAPRFMPWLAPYERGQELTLRDIVPEALVVRGWRSKAGAELLARSLPDPKKNPAAQGQFVAWARIVASGDPALLTPHLPALRAGLKLTPENRPYAVQTLGLMGAAAAGALGELETWRADPKLDPRIASQIDEAISRIKKSK